MGIEPTFSVPQTDVMPLYHIQQEKENRQCFYSILILFFEQSYEKVSDAFKKQLLKEKGLLFITAFSIPSKSLRNEKVLGVFFGGIGTTQSVDWCKKHHHLNSFPNEFLKKLFGRGQSRTVGGKLMRLS